jgi:HEAT repeat protein
MPGKQGPHPDAYDRRDLVDLENRVVDRLCQALDDGAASVRAAAVEALERWDELPASAVEHLSGFVNRSRDNRALTRALGVLRKSNEFPESLIPQMVGLFSRRDEQLAGAAADLLTKVGEPAVPALIEVLQQGKSAVVKYAIRALHDMGWRAAAAAPHLVPFASSRDAGRRAFVIEIIGQMRVPEVALPTMRKALKDRNKDVRRQAAWGIARMGTEGAEAIPDLLKRVKDADDGVRLAVLKALGQVGADEATLLRVYQSAVDDAYDSIRSHALDGLVNVAKGHTKVFARVTPHCQDQDRYVRAAAIRAVCALAPSASEAVPWVRQLLNDPEEYVRDAAAEAFLALGPAASSVDPELFCRLAGQGARVSRLLVRTMQALTRREREDLIPTLVGELGDDDVNGRQSAALWLRALGADGEAALREASQSPDPNIRSAAEFGLKARPEGAD